MGLLLLLDQIAQLISGSDASSIAQQGGQGLVADDAFGCVVGKQFGWVDLRR